MTHSGPLTPLESRANGPLNGRVRVAGDKSISHRALILGALSVGETRISGLLEGEDVLNTAKSMRALGARVERTGEGAWTGKVIHSENLGSDSYVYADMGSDEPIVVREDGTRKHQPGEPISIRPVPGQVHRFDAEGKPLGRQ